ncbi:MAG: SUMF1/EgtB/PvdO family nonheme iron enzyme [Anaerolineae bacterium]|uniref:SUMF1/EgtB/PvdO family nonheme iron enzyme n=1 Tax=Candidatus Amarolinea dominans TaxID=3140696 RepID=UPI0031376A25|nr:SUMF1/EgtB/PvdO family nonheme iron enzyme [Anaerolineae bacterium]
MTTAAANTQPRGHWQRVLVLGEAYTRPGAKAKEAEKRELRERVMAGRRLTAAMHGALPARQRLQAGLLLDALGVEPPGLEDFVAAPGWGFAIGRYPVTNKQYRRFVEAGGYAAENEKRWWSEEGQKDKRQYKWTEPRYWDSRSTTTRSRWWASVGTKPTPTPPG